MPKIFGKSIISVALSVSVFFGVAVPGYAQSNQVPQVSTTSLQKTLYTADGETLGSVKEDTKVSITRSVDQITIKVTKNSDYELERKYANIEEYQERFIDGSKTETFIIKDDQLYHDGKILNSSDLSLRSTTDTGGIPAISHYNSTKDLKVYNFSTYDDVKFNAFNAVLMSPAGNNITRTTSPSHAFFNSAKSAVDNFYNDNQDYVFAISGFLVASGTALATWETIIGAIAGGGAAALAAIQVVTKFNDCKDDVSDAYLYISQF
ncbi:hypothetical protein D3C76_245650 [compost metagenome]